ncbi:unnamed protein product [Lathyrus sativus]|nr:unnamed protein product [Lathyrus sativus]
MSKAFNSVFVSARAKPIVTMLEEIIVYLMQRWELNRQNISKYADAIILNIKKKLEKELQRTNSWIVRRAGEVDYKVSHISLIEEKFVVNLSKHECSCRRWVLIGIPCCRALSYMKDQHLKVDDLSLIITKSSVMRLVMYQ